MFVQIAEKARIDSSRMSVFRARMLTVSEYAFASLGAEIGIDLRGL